MKTMRWLIGAIALLVCVAYAADELQISVGWTYNKNGRKRTLVTTATQFDIAGNGVIENVQAVSTNTVGDALVLGSATNGGFAWFKNVSTSNYVEIGTGAGGTFAGFLRLNTNEIAACWLGVTNPYARANGSPVNLDYVITDK